MKVIDHNRGSWFLLQDNERYIFDVYIDARFVGYGVTLYLNEQEIANYLTLGHDFLDKLALKVNENVLSRNFTAQNRLVKDKDLSDLITKIIVEWRKETDTNL